MSQAVHFGSGWRPDDHAEDDCLHDHPRVVALHDSTGVAAAIADRTDLPDRVDLSAFCGPVKFQGNFNTCTAHVAVEMVELMERKAHGQLVEGSRLFLYKAVKNLLHEVGNVPVHLRQTLGALELVGLPPEKFWPYLNPGTYEAPNDSDPRIDEEPPAFCYAIARDYRGALPYRLDDPGLQGDVEAIHRAKVHLAAGFPVSLGIRLFESVKQARPTGEIPLPAPTGDEHTVNHAVLLVGYDDRKEIRNRLPGGPASTGAFKFQNSWSAKWGDEGFGWVPYEYAAREGVAGDMWSMAQAEWIETGAFGLEL